MEWTQPTDSCLAVAVSTAHLHMTTGDKLTQINPKIALNMSSLSCSKQISCKLMHNSAKKLKLSVSAGNTTALKALSMRVFLLKNQSNRTPWMNSPHWDDSNGSFRSKNGEADAKIHHPDCPGGWDRSARSSEDCARIPRRSDGPGDETWQSGAQLSE